MPELADVFTDLEDPQASNARRHSRHDILVIALGTVPGGGQTGAGLALLGQARRDFLQSFLKLENGVPRHDTFSRAPGMLRFRRQFAEGIGGFIAVSGRQDTAPLLRPRRRALAAASGQRVGRRRQPCQRRMAQQVAAPDGDYALAWQSNAGTLRDDVPLFLDEPAAPMAQATQVNKGHGRIATRSASVSSDVA